MRRQKARPSARRIRRRRVHGRRREPAAPAAIETEADPADERRERQPSYVPMAEWLDDFDRR